MDIMDRETLKKEYPDIIAGIQKRHEMHPDVPVELFKRNKPVKGLTHARSYYVILDSNPTLYIRYTMRYQILNREKGQIGRAVDEVIIYDDYIEFEADRVKNLSAKSPDQQDGLNLN